MKILIIQSCSPRASEWIRDCMHTVETWASLKGYDYQRIGDNLFDFTPISLLQFTNVTRSDFARLAWIWAELKIGKYDAVIWLDADFLIWNPLDFNLPMPEPGAVLCAREAFYFNPVNTPININNSVLGLCCTNDAEILIERSREILRRCGATPRMTVIGTDFFSSRKFPLRQIIAKQAGCFSEESIKLILGPHISSRRHLFWLSMASGATLAGANLCSSRETDNIKMKGLVHGLIRWNHLEIGRLRYFSPLYRIYLRIENFPDRIRCWLLSRWYEIRKTPILRS